MSGVAIYMEGGGDSRDTKAALRRGMDGLLAPLKAVARRKEMHWKLVCCGPRGEAFRGFQNAVRNTDDSLVVLLVDAEGPVQAEPRAHLYARDEWDMTGVNARAVHLMVQAMETWIVADSEALGRYYGQGFNAQVLPATADLERVSKRDVEHSLRRATERTQKGRYHKIRHASDLLQRMDVASVKRRCRHCQRLFDELERVIDAA